VPALEEFFGTEAGLSSATIIRLTEQWQKERESFMSRDLSLEAWPKTPWADCLSTLLFS
jgi:hypothetical protein